MANFATHLGVGTIASGMAATLAVATEMINQTDIMTLAIAGTIGSIMPDIDLKESRPSRIIFFVLGLFLSIVVLFSVVGKYSVAELWIIWIAAFLGVRYVLHMMFHNFAVHRGVFHSILAGVFFLMLTTAIVHLGFQADPRICWLAGIFMLFGYLIHLSLDEIYSVDFSGNRIKRSFGTALKLIEYRDPAASFLMAVGVVLVFFLTPPFHSLYETVATTDVLTHLWDHMWPKGNWFGIDYERLQAVFTFDAVAQPQSQVQPQVQPLGQPQPPVE